MTSLNQILDQLNRDLAAAHTVEDIESLKINYLGRKGEINEFVKAQKPESLRLIGGQIKETKNQIETLLNGALANIQDLHRDKGLDISIPGVLPPIGHTHLITQAIEEIEEIFSKLGFVRRRYPEVETDWYYAEGLNIPKDHPARDDQETFYLSDSIVLTAHTSNGQLHEMETMKEPPIKMINIGKTYRRQSDTSHVPMFHQFEGLLIDKDISITHLIGVSDFFVKEYFGPTRKTRLRPHHFQFTEPSFEVDISCGVCNGTGKIDGTKCRLCKAGWLELGGAGMVHPNVLKNGGIDPAKYSGFAFGWGVERVAVMKVGGISDVRDVYSTDLRLLNQF